MSVNLMGDMFNKMKDSNYSFLSNNQNNQKDISNKKSSFKDFQNFFDSSKSNSNSNNIKVNTKEEKVCVKDNKKSENSENINLDKPNNNQNENISNEKVSDEKLLIENEEVDKQESLEIEKTESSSEKEKIEINKNINNYNIFIYNQNVVEQISKILNIPSEKIVDTLSDLKLTISELGEQQNLINFVQEVLELDRPEDLINIENIKNAFSEIKNISKDISYVEVIEPNVQDIESLKDIKQNAFIIISKDKENINIEFEENILNFIQSFDNDEMDNIKLNDTFNFNEINVNPELNAKVQEVEIKTEKHFYNNKKIFIKDTHKGFEELEHNMKEQEINPKPTLNKLESTFGEIKIEEKPNLEKPIIAVEEEFTEEIDIEINNNSENNEFNMFNKDNFLKGNEETKFKITEEKFEVELNNIPSSLGGYEKSINTNINKVEIQKSINSVEVINQIMDKIKTSIKPDVSEIKLLLKPEFLGEVSLKITSQNGIINAQFIAENQKVKEIIESNFNQLKDMLNEQGLDVTGLDVSVNDNRNENQDNRNFEAFSFAKEKSEERIKDIIQKINNENSSRDEYLEKDEVVLSNVNYSV